MVLVQLDVEFIEKKPGLTPKRLICSTLEHFAIGYSASVSLSYEADSMEVVF